MKTTKFTLPLMAFACILLSFSSGFKSAGKEVKWIPDDFDARKSTLLVQNFSIKDNPNKFLKKAQDKATDDMKATMQANYPYKYEFVSKDDLNNGSKYADKSKYRWVLMVNNTRTETLGGMGDNSSNDFCLYDRKNDTPSPNAGHASSGVKQAMKPALASIVSFLKALK